ATAGCSSPPAVWTPRPAQPASAPPLPGNLAATARHSDASSVPLPHEDSASILPVALPAGHLVECHTEVISMPTSQELDDWARRVVPRALAYARSLTRDESRADDLVQECLYRLLRRADHYDLVADGVKLLFRAISNLAINQ